MAVWTIVDANLDNVKDPPLLARHRDLSKPKARVAFDKQRSPRAP